MLAERLLDDVQTSGRVHAWLAAAVLLLAAGFAFFFVGVVLVATTRTMNPIIPIAIGSVLVIAGGIALGTLGPPPLPRRRPDPSVIRKPCPKCGTWPRAVTAHGFARCEECREPFFAS